jgi:hypothetical protein
MKSRGKHSVISFSFLGLYCGKPCGQLSPPTLPDNSLLIDILCHFIALLISVDHHSEIQPNYIKHKELSLLTMC